MIDSNNENTLWTGKPEFKPFIVKSSYELLAYGLFIGFVYIVVSYIGAKNNLETYPWIMYGFYIIVACQAIYQFIKRQLEFSKLEYEITDDSVRIISGIFDKSIKLIKRDQIQFIDLKKNVIEQFFNVGTIRFYSGKLTKGHEDKLKKEFDKFESITDYDLIMKILEKK